MGKETDSQFKKDNKILDKYLKKLANKLIERRENDDLAGFVAVVAATTTYNEEGESSHGNHCFVYSDGSGEERMRSLTIAMKGISGIIKEMGVIDPLANHLNVDPNDKDNQKFLAMIIMMKLAEVEPVDLSRWIDQLPD